MSEDEFEYDVAFSFLAEDESVAQRLGDLLRDRFKVFIYSEQQKKLAGGDGEQIFNEVFGEKARVVAVLYRDAWGTTPFTRIEMNAIKNRAFDNGYDFTLFVPMEAGVGAPKWLPKTHIYFSLDRFGADGAAAVLAHIITERGGAAKVENASDRAARLGRSLQLQSAQQKFAQSHEGAKAARNAAQEVHQHISALIEEFTRDHPTVPRLQVARQDDYSILYGARVVLVLTWRGMYMNSIANAKFTAEFYDGMPRMFNRARFDEPKKIGSLEFRYGLIEIDRSAFISVKPQRQYAPSELADELLRLYMDYVEKQGPE